MGLSNAWALQVLNVEMVRILCIVKGHLHIGIGKSFLGHLAGLERRGDLNYLLATVLC